MNVKYLVTNTYVQLAVLSVGAPLVMLAVVCLVFALALAPDTRPHPTDDVLIDKWTRHRGEFDELLGMFQSDQRLGRVAPTFTRPERWADAGVAPARIKDYRRRCDDLGLEAGIEGYDEKDVVWFIASARGLSVTGSGKGYVYMTQPPELVVPSLDKYWSSDGRSFTAYRHLDGNWYLFFDYED
jgi:hypothetical protein